MSDIHLLKMRIGFDLRPFLREETGVGVYFKNLLFHLAEIDQDNEYFLFSSSWKDRFELAKIPPFRRKRFHDFRWPVKAINFFWHKFRWPHLDSFFQTSLDLTHSPTPLFLPTRGKKVVTVCDLFFMDFPRKADKEARKSFLIGTEKALKQADGIITISRFTKEALLEKFDLEEKKIKVTYLGLNQVFKEEVKASELEETRLKHNLPPSFILFVGASEPRKNILNLIDALQILHHQGEKFTLILVGRKGSDCENLSRRVANHGLQPWVRMLGYLPETELRNIYYLASALAFPSYCEGFGLPLLEAMACGLPIAASGVSALPEIAGGAALYFCPESSQDIAEKLSRVLKDENLRQVLKAKGKKEALKFSWKTTAEETLSFYRSILEKG